MEKGSIKILYGEGRGKSIAALGRAVQAAAQGENVFIIQFLKEKNDPLMDMIKRLEPEIKFFRFEKKDERYEDLSDEEKQEEKMNIKNGINFAKKVLVTGECSLLILDEALGLVDCDIISWEELNALLSAKSDDTEIVLTGRVLNDTARDAADEICHMVSEK